MGFRACVNHNLLWFPDANMVTYVVGNPYCVAEGFVSSSILFLINAESAEII